MARSAAQDPIEKFRFLVTVFRPQSQLVNVSASLVSPSDTIEGRMGFKEATIPDAKTAVINYRENIDGFSYRKIAGLTSYDPITFRRGVMKDTNLFQMFTDTNNEASALNTFNSALASGLGAISFQSPTYRKDLLISTLDRNGNFTKHWYISNAFASHYKGGNDLDASIDEKLIEEVTFEYEFFIEVLGNSVEEALSNVSEAAKNAAGKQAEAKGIGIVAGTAGGLLPF